MKWTHTTTKTTDKIQIKIILYSSQILGSIFSTQKIKSILKTVSGWFFGIQMNGAAWMDSSAVARFERNNLKPYKEELSRDLTMSFISFKIFITIEAANWNHLLMWSNWPRLTVSEITVNNRYLVLVKGFLLL